jgi:hypothetical protein
LRKRWMRECPSDICPNMRARCPKSLGKSIACLPTTKLLGLYISDNFSWQTHADNVVGWLESAVFLLSNLLKVVSKRELRVVYHAFSYSIIQYGIIFWDSSFQRPPSSRWSMQTYQWVFPLLRSIQVVCSCIMLSHRRFEIFRCFQTT